MLVDGCSDNDTIVIVSSHLSSAICVLKATEFHEPEPLVVHKRPASNANKEHQLRFHSTTKKRAKMLSLRS